jgi:hypothetical protein
MLADNRPAAIPHEKRCSTVDSFRVLQIEIGDGIGADGVAISSENALMEFY